MSHSWDGAWTPGHLSSGPRGRHAVCRKSGCRGRRRGHPTAAAGRSWAQGRSAPRPTPRPTQTRHGPRSQTCAGITQPDADPESGVSVQVRGDPDDAPGCQPAERARGGKVLKTLDAESSAAPRRGEAMPPAPPPPLGPLCLPRRCACRASRCTLEGRPQVKKSGSDGGGGQQLVHAPRVVP